MKLTLLLSIIVFSFSSLAQDSRHRIQYPQGWKERQDVPIFPSPGGWFQFKQRYAYRSFKGKNAKKENPFLELLNGYGNFYPDIHHKGKSFKAMAWMTTESSPPELSSQSYVRIHNYDFDRELRGMTWFSLGFGATKFSDDIIAFHYPLTLGKTWQSKTDFKGLPVVFQAKVSAYIPPDAQSEADIIVADGMKYKLPIPFEMIPPPLAELGQMTLRELAVKGERGHYTRWENVRVPDGDDPNIPRGKPTQGYYAVETQVKLAGKVVYRQELWKDVRGAVPVYSEKRSFPLSFLPKIKTKVATAWSGNDVEN